MSVDTQFLWDDANHGTLHVKRTQDVEPIIESVNRIRTLTPSKEMRHVARFPMVIVEHYCNQHGITFAEWMRNPVHAERMLQDRDLSKFHTNKF